MQTTTISVAKRLAACIIRPEPIHDANVSQENKKLQLEICMLKCKIQLQADCIESARSLTMRSVT